MSNNPTVINKNLLKEIKSIHIRLQGDIKLKLDRFKNIGTTGNDLEIFSELAFCLLTPQSKAKVCWPVIEDLMENEMLLKRTEEQLGDDLCKVRFRYTKAKNLIAAKKLFTDGGHLSIKSKLAKFDDPLETREWLVENVRGMSYKEASHFLRNIGHGEHLAILDRHILKNLKLMNIIDNIPKSLSKKRYLEIEKQMTEFATKVRIPLAHMDLLLWYKETGEIFK